MTAAWTPPSRLSHIRLFALGTVALAAFLLVVLFGVHMEAVAPASGIVAARDLIEVRTALAGLVEPGWYDGELVSADGSTLAVRLDARGNGTTDPSAGSPRTVVHYRTHDFGPRAAVPRDRVRFHPLQPGDVLWPGQVVAALQTDEWQRELDLLELEFDPPSSGRPPSPTRLRREELRRRLARAVVQTPDNAAAWLAVEVRAVPGQAVAAGDLVATLAPCEPHTGRPRELLVRLRLDETHRAGVEPGQPVRLFSNVYNHRLYGVAEGVIERVDPTPETGADGVRRYAAVAAVRAAPFELPLGSGCRAEIVVGRKLVYRIILEH
jgi:hypothetical protein